MAVLDFFKKIFNKNKVEEAKTQESKSLPIYNANVETIEPKKEEVENILNSIQVNKGALALEKLESEAEALNSYLKPLVKDISTYEDNIHDKEKISDSANNISAKMKHIILHGLELKNLLGVIEDQYYSTLISALKEVNEKLQKEGINKIIEALEKDNDLLKELEVELGKLVVYDYKLNSERNEDYLNAIDDAVKDKTLLNDVNSLINKLTEAIANRATGLRSKIERSNPIEKVRQVI